MLAIHDDILKYRESSPTPSPLLTEKVEKGDLGFKSGFGFRKWTPEKMSQVRMGLETHLFSWPGSGNIAPRSARGKP